MKEPPAITTDQAFYSVILDVLRDIRADVRGLRDGKPMPSKKGAPAVEDDADDT